MNRVTNRSHPSRDKALSAAGIKLLFVIRFAGTQGLRSVLPARELIPQGVEFAAEERMKTMVPGVGVEPLGGIDST